MPKLRFGSIFQKYLKPVVYGGLALATIYGLFLWRLGNLSGGFSTNEKLAVANSANIDKLLNDPINLPHKLLQAILQSLGYHGTTSMRFVSVIFALAMILCFFIILRWWFRTKVAAVATIALAFSPVLIINSRLATADILLATTLPVIFAVYLWVLRAKRTVLASMLCLAMAGALATYIPGSVWVLLVGLILFGKTFWKMAAKYNKYLPYALHLIYLLIISPLLWAIWQSPELLKRLLFIPDIWAAPFDIVKEIAWSLLGVFWRTRDNMALSLGYLPILSIFAVIMGLFGLVYIATQYKRKRSYALALIIIVIGVIAGINKNFQLMLISLPVLYVLVAAGVDWLLQEWHTVFPRNPLARALAMFMLIAALSIHCFFGIRYALVAWPKAPETKSSHMLQ